MSTVGTRRRKQRVPQLSRGGAGSAGTEPPSAGPRATRFRLAGDDYIVLSYPKADLTAPAALTSTEQAVFSELLRGRSNRDIAESRGRAMRTVANQVAAIFRKLEVGSRTELVAKFNGRRSSS